MDLGEKDLPEKVAELTARVEKLQAELTAAYKELDAFSHSVSHDLRAPLRAIQGFSQIALEECSDVLPETGREYLTRVSTSARKMSGLIDDLLKLSRIGRTPLSRMSLDVSALARAVWRRLSGSEPGRESQLIIAEGLRVHADRRLLELLFEHLLGNARKFTGRLQSPQIEVGSRDIDGEPVLFVRDNGVGFEQAYVARLFAPFQRLHTERDFPGSGIGLAIVHRIVRRHGGRVWAESGVGAGATIYFTLPDGADPR